MTYRQRMKEYEDSKTNTGKSAVKSRSRGSDDELYRVPRSEALEMLNIDAEPSSYRPYDGQSVLPHMKNECCFLISPIDGRYGRDEKMEMAEALAHDLKINAYRYLPIYTTVKDSIVDIEFLVFPQSEDNLCDVLKYMVRLTKGLGVRRFYQLNEKTYVSISGDGSHVSDEIPYDDVEDILWFYSFRRGLPYKNTRHVIAPTATSGSERDFRNEMGEMVL